MTIGKRSKPVTTVQTLKAPCSSVHLEAPHARPSTALGAAVYVLLKRGDYRLAVRLYIWGAGLIVMGFTFIAAGVRTPSLVFLPVLCMAAAWLISARNALMLTACSLFVIFFHLVTESLGYAPPNLPRNSLSYVLMYFFTFVAAAIVAWGSTRSFTAQMARSNPPCSTSHRWNLVGSSAW